MTREETIKVMSVLKAAYPNFYKNMSKDEAIGVINLWTIQLGDMPVDIVMIAINKIIATSKWPPAIAEIKDKIKSMYYEAIGSLSTVDLDDRQRNALFRISKYCRLTEEEPSLIQLTRKIGDEIEAHDKLEGNMPSLQTRR